MLVLTVLMFFILRNFSVEKTENITELQGPILQSVQPLIRLLPL